MPKFRQIAQILELMGKKERIRNVGIIAHIDHGKTTMTDSLLAAAGLLSPRIAGSARVLDYLEEEQKRGITIKTANISLMHEAKGSSFVINLVDTPGHVDFTGKVTRALRAIDGAVVVVDAVEEIMVQTEVVTRQALEERVKAVLFINKVDRLINELRLTAEEIQNKFARIISDFNNLIEIYGEPPFRDGWKVDAAKGSVAFGSALHKWGFTLGIAEKKGMKFSDVMDAYKSNNSEMLQKIIPLHDAVLDIVVQNVPNPVEAQRYRIGKIWKGNLDSEWGQAMLNCDEKGPAIMCITNVQADPNMGAIATGRLFSGSAKEEDKVYLVNADKEYDVKQVSMYMGAFREPVSQITAGNIAALVGFELARAGETLVDAAHKVGMVPFERIKYVSEPVVTVAVEPKDPSDLPRLLEAMGRLSIEDPNLVTTVSRETGEYLLSGMGELHLEIGVKFLSSYVGGMEIAASSPTVEYRESVVRKGVVATAKSPNKQNKFAVQVEPLKENLAKLIDKGEFGKQVRRVLAVDEHRNAIMNLTENVQHFQEAKDFMISGFRFTCAAGPLCGEPLRNVKVNLLKVELHDDVECREPVEVMRGVGKAIFGSILTAKPILLEPVYEIVITVPAELAGECSRILTSRRGKISLFEQKGISTMITGYIPVVETFGLTEEMRSATSGRAFWQCVFDRWEEVPESIAAEVIRQVRMRKGLPREVPKPSTFLGEN